MEKYNNNNNINNNLSIPWTQCYKNIFSVELRYAQIWAFWLVNWSHVTSISQSKCLNSSVAMKRLFFYKMGSWTWINLKIKLAKAVIELHQLVGGNTGPF